MTRSTASGTDQVRRANLSRVLWRLHTEGTTTRAELTTRIGLNRSTVGGLVRELAERGLVREGEPRPTGGPGRPSTTVDVRTDRTCAIALDIKVDSLAAAAFGLGGHRIHTERVERPRRRISVDATLDDLSQLARTVHAALSGDQQLVGVGAAVVGLVRQPAGVVEVAPNLGWEDVPLAAMLRERLLGTPLDADLPVMVTNDGDAGGLAERIHGAARGVSDLLYLSGEVGIGGGILVGGHELTGTGGLGGEIGHLTLDLDGPECGCGSRGCWETLIGESALLRSAGLPTDGGRQAVAEVLDAAERGEQFARDALDEVGTWLGIGLSGLVNVFDPERIVLGGLHAALYPYVVGPARRILAERSLVGRRSFVEVVPAALGVESSLVGAAELALRHVLEDPTLAPRASRGIVPH